MQAWVYRHATNPDGLSYLDLANAFRGGDFRTAISASWGPIYPALLAAGLRVARPAPEWLLALVHAVNFTIFLITLVIFDWFLQELLRARHGEDVQGKPTLVMSDIGLAVFAYAVFVYSALGLIGLGLITPDLCVEAACFAAAGLALRMCDQRPRRTTAVLLGLALGIGYMTKSVMFPLGAALLVSLMLTPSLRNAASTVGLAAGVFVTVASLLVVPISLETGGLSFGMAGKLAYAFSTNRVPFTNWQGDSTPSGPQPLHPPRQLSNNPEVFEYVANLKGTYPPWFDPPYWTAGLRAELRPRNQVLRLLRSGEYYLELFIGSPGVAATLLVALVCLSTDASVIAWGLRQFLPLTVLGLAGLAIYTPVLVEARYVAPFAALLWILPPAVARWAKPTGSERWIDRAPFGCAACLVIAVGARLATDGWRLHGEPDVHPRIAGVLAGLGVRPGDRVVNIGIERESEKGSSFDAFWAHLAGVQIVAEMPDGRDFLCAPGPTTEGLYAEFERLGARAVVTEAMPSRSCAAGWRNVEGTDYYVRPLGGDER
jgi:uncharacterized membrane protein (DUF441 family)